MSLWPSTSACLRIMVTAWAVVGLVQVIMLWTLQRRVRQSISAWWGCAESGSMKKRAPPRFTENIRDQISTSPPRVSEEKEGLYWAEGSSPNTTWIQVMVVHVLFRRNFLRTSLWDLTNSNIAGFLKIKRRNTNNRNTTPVTIRIVLAWCMQISHHIFIHL